jgi:hypothetical protein
MAIFNILDFGAVGDGQNKEIQPHHKDTQGPKKTIQIG